MGVSGACLCVRVLAAEGVAVSQGRVDSLHKESASLVDPVQMCRVYHRLVLSTGPCLLRVRIVPLCCQYVRWHEFFTPRN